MTALDHLRIAVTGGVLLFVILEITFQLWRNREAIAAAIGIPNRSDASW